MGLWEGREQLGFLVWEAAPKELRPHVNEGKAERVPDSLAMTPNLLWLLQARAKQSL